MKHAEVEKLEALAKEWSGAHCEDEYTKGEAANELWALIAFAREEPADEHQLDQARRNWRHWQQRAEIAEGRLAPPPGDGGLREQAWARLASFAKHATDCAALDGDDCTCGLAEAKRTALGRPAEDIRP